MPLGAITATSDGGVQSRVLVASAVHRIDDGNSSIIAGIVFNPPGMERPALSWRVAIQRNGMNLRPGNGNGYNVYKGNTFDALTGESYTELRGYGIGLPEAESRIFLPFSCSISITSSTRSDIVIESSVIVAGLEVQDGILTCPYFRTFMHNFASDDTFRTWIGT